VESAVMLKENIEYSAITLIKETKYATITYSASVSMDQIEIRYIKRPGTRDKDETVFVSPSKKEEFLAKLLSKLPDPGVYVEKKQKKAKDRTRRSR
jgi:hypothetical protein